MHRKKNQRNVMAREIPVAKRTRRCVVSLRYDFKWLGEDSRKDVSSATSAGGGRATDPRLPHVISSSFSSDGKLRLTPEGVPTKY